VRGDSLGKALANGAGRPETPATPQHVGGEVAVRAVKAMIGFAKDMHRDERACVGGAAGERR